jgi:hypothetical protein
MRESNPQNRSRFQKLRQALLLSAAVGSLAASAMIAQAQTTVQVDSTKPWGGYMNVYDNVGGTQGGYLWGSTWGTPALTAYFTGTSYLTIIPNTNTWNVTDNYWVNTNTVPFSGAKWMEANFYVDVGTAYAGQTVTFIGDVLTNNLVSPYTCLAVIKEFGPGYSYVGMTTEPLVPGSPFTVSRTIGAGNITQYGFITTGPNANPATVASLGAVAVKVNNADPSLSTVASSALIEGQTATFSVTAQGTFPMSYQWSYTDGVSTNALSNGGRISGAKTNTLTIANVALTDAGSYFVTVTNTHGSGVAGATLTVIPASSIATNLLVNPAFENGVFTSSGDAGWFNFSGSAYQSTNDYYYLSDQHVTVVNGSNCVQVYPSGSYNGVYQDRPALPGQVYTANCWFLTPTDDHIANSNVCYLEVQFRTAADVTLVQYSSANVTSTSPASVWMNLAPTNIHSGDFTQFLGTSPYMIAPAGTAKVRYQITYHSIDGFGSVYIDAANLMVREPNVTAAKVGGDVQLSFPTLFGPKYQAYYKTNVTEATWHAVGSPVTGNGNVMTISDPIGATGRIYVVNTLLQ